MAMENGVLASIITDFRGASLDNSLRIVGSLGQISASFFVLPQIYHNLEVSSFTDAQAAEDQIAEKQVTVRYEKQYGSGFSSYHYQLEAFVSAVKDGAPFSTTGEDGVKNMKTIEMIYDAAGLPRRGIANPIA
jgi:predicted dehydrogenase